MYRETIDLAKTAAEYKQSVKGLTRRITICAGTGCMANGAEKVYKTFITQIRNNDLDAVVELKEENKGIHLSKSGCQGFCQMGPLVTIDPDGLMYVRVKPEDVRDIVRQTLCEGKVLERLLYSVPATGVACKGRDDIPFYARQSRFVLKQCGLLDPENLNEYIAAGGYASAQKAYCEMTAEEVCSEILESGLRGRGGAGFPTGRKWDLARIQPEGKKFIICNGDEGDPGAFMDRSLMEGNPHSVLEGMMIAGRGIGADEAYVYVRAEYPLAVKRIRKAVQNAEEAGLLGENIFGSGFSFRINVMEGAGAFVCGEETALMASIEGKRGMPTPKPPFPAQSGLFGRPTVINNVETLSTVPLIIALGAKSFKENGTVKSPGTKTFALTGHVANTGLIEVPFGTTLREVVFNIGGGVLNNDGTLSDEGFKLVQIGGPSGGCLTEEHLDMPLDFDSLSGIGAMVGSGGLVVMNKQTCIVTLAKYFMTFTQNESCGKCVLCREGTKQMLSLLDDIIEGHATTETLDLLEKLAKAVMKGSLCGLGKTAPNPVLSTMKHFRAEYNEHVINKFCRTKNCRSLVVPEIDQEICKGCTVCKKKCPVNAISGERKMAHTIDASICIRCGACAEACKLNAITGV